ncbi:MAG: YraN family protein [Halothiobacillaceae bacterium]|nr:MAG: YraN family protein [Halothiobacillaceae bacterium]
MTERSEARQACGAAGEQHALEHLERQGLRLVARNVHARGGEIDLVMLDGPALVFVEVRARAARGLVGALESVTPAKQRRIVTAARIFLGRNPQHAQRACRFDVVGITHAAGKHSIEWLQNAFEASPA